MIEGERERERITKLSENVRKKGNKEKSQTLSSAQNYLYLFVLPRPERSKFHSWEQLLRILSFYLSFPISILNFDPTIFSPHMNILRKISE